MKYLAVLFWSIVLLQMINFVLNSLNGGGELNYITPIFGAIAFTIIIALFDMMIKPSKHEAKEHH
ncbi:YjzD family protein [Staphylococcus xylosus]|uniref:DUF2929 family protein n=1 Tax=Staphylococcus xylosus TaxID=1288 RepID=A0AAQ0RY99_STAXY|nr:YjzD family protein [Staphylococcus xylosus]RIM64753.1 DUF2929 family protein [Staphylococcus xylosus]RIM93022.1 DUF2929 family protein [Staphylococcus xylosus]